MKTRRFLLVFVTIMLPLVANASFDCLNTYINGIYYELDDRNKTACVSYRACWTDYYGGPDEYGIVPVDYNYESNYYGDIIIPSSVDYYGTIYTITAIHDHAFYHCTGLNSVTIPSSIKSIGEEAFNGCTGLRTVYISDLKTWCEIQISDKTSNPLYYAHHLFLNGIEIIELNIPQSVTSIGKYAFYNCSHISSVTIPNSVSSIGEGAFYKCSGLTSVTISTNITSIGAYVFYKCTGLTSVSIPDGVTSIGSSAFSGCTSLISVRIPSSLTDIEGEAFSHCPLVDVFCYNKKVPSTSNTAFTQKKILHVPPESLEEYRTISPWKDFEQIIPISGYHLIYLIDGVEYKSYELEYGASITPEVAPTKEGYTFSGWSEIPKTMPANDVTVTGTFTINKYKLTYYVDGEEYKSYEIEYGSSITPEAEPSKEGYTFSGWSSIPKTMPANDVTITGKFTINKYKLIYKVDDAEYKTYDVEYGASITPEAAPTKEGYTFSGWSWIPTKMPSEDVIVTGTFTVNKYKLIYRVDGVEYKSYDVEYGASITPEAAPTKEGYTFSGWSWIPTKMPSEDVIVTGTFTVNKYKLIYKVDDAEYKTYDVEYGAAITPEAAPTKEGYTFSGWSDIPKTMPANDVTITGKFTINKYKLTYYVDGEEYKSYELEYGASITPEAEPTKDGYTFSGWSSIPKTMPANDVTVSGTFSKGSFKLIYMVDGAVYKTINYDYGDAITPEAEPTKEGYTFSGWSEIPKTMPANDVTVTGTFTINKYKLTYYVDGVEYKSYEIEYGAKIVPEKEPTKKDYTFSGWSEIPKTMPAHDVTVTGTFEHHYDVGDVVNLINIIMFGSGDENDLALYDMNHDGELNIGDLIILKRMTLFGMSRSAAISFDGEYQPSNMPLSAGYSGNIIADDISLKPGETKALNIALSPSINGIFGIQFDVCLPQGFTLEKGSDDKVYKMSAYQVDDITCSEMDLGNGVYRFIIYSATLQELKGGHLMSLNLKAGGNQTLGNYSASISNIAMSDFDGNVTKENGISVRVRVTDFFTLLYIVDGMQYKAYMVEYEERITPEAEPTKEGYTFSGWSEIPETMPAYDVTVKGSFTVNKYKLTYMVDGEVYKTFEVEYGATITPEPAPNKEGYDFSGWDNVPETMPAHDVTVNGSLTVGITDILMNSGEVKIFDMKGNQIGKLQKGINILIYKNGESKKVIIK